MEEKLTIEQWDKDVHAEKLTDGSMTPQISEAAYMCLGLAGETGETFEKVKKIIRDKKCIWDENDRNAICKEVGDIIWYAAGLAGVFGIPIQEVIETNHQKIMSRTQRNVLSGSGDER